MRTTTITTRATSIEPSVTIVTYRPVAAGGADGDDLRSRVSRRGDPPLHRTVLPSVLRTVLRTVLPTVLGTALRPQLQRAAAGSTTKTKYRGFSRCVRERAATV
jgi:hypothetical protein